MNNVMFSVFNEECKKCVKAVLVFTFVVVMNISALGKVEAIGYANTPATGIIGQQNYLSSTINSGNLSGSLHSPKSVYSDGEYTFVADTNNNRVLIYIGVPGIDGADTIADVVIGQPNMTTNAINKGGVSATSLYYPYSVFSDGQHVFVADTYNNRVLIYNGIPGINGADTIADVVIGQPNMSSNLPNNGGLSSSSLSSPVSVYSDSQHLFIADISNSRVLIYNGIPGIDGADTIADVVIGQPNMSSNLPNNGGINASTLNYPYSVSSSGQNLLIADSSNNRVLVYNGIPGFDGADTIADTVIGQPNMTSNTANNGGLSAGSFYFPYSVFSDSTHTFVADYTNNRVLIYNGIPGINGADVIADTVIGQPSMTSGTLNNGGIGSSSLARPFSVFSDGTHTFVADSSNNRVLIYNGIPGTNGADAVADTVSGQFSMASNTINSSGVSASSMYLPRGIYSDGSRTYIADSSNNRVLIYNGTPNEPGWDNIADYVIGQPNMTSGLANNGGISASTLNTPKGVYSDGDRVYVVDTGNNRILIYDGIPGEPGWNNVADTVIGQPNMTSNAANNGGISASSLSNPYGVFRYENYLYVVDLSNHRILIFNGIPGVNGADAIADDVIGQANMTTGNFNSGGRSASRFYSPASFYTDGQYSIVPDADNHRVLIFNGAPGINGADKVADYVIGQPNMTTGTINYGGLSASSLYNPNSAYYDGQRLIVSDSYNNRVLIYIGLPGVNGADAVADVIIGQPNATSNTANNGGISASTLYYSAAVYASNNDILVSDNTNNRVLFYKTGPQGITVSLPSSTNSINNTITLASTDAKEMMISIDSNFTGAQWENFATTKGITLTPTEGPTMFYVKLRDYANYESSVIPKTIIYDVSAPSGSVKINNDTVFTNTKDVELTLNATDTLSTVTEMMISSDSNFADASWETYSSTKSWTLSIGDGIKTVFAKFKDAAGNESSVVSDSIVLDTIGPEIKITNLGLINNVPDKTALFYYFTSQTPLIKGTSEAGSTVHFVYGSNDYTTTTDAEGNFQIKSPELPRELITLTYYSQDFAGNKSETRTLKLLIGAENFPQEDATEQSNATEGIIVPTPSITPSTQPENPINTIVAISVIDGIGNPIKNSIVIVNEQEYKTDAQGKLYLERKPTDKESINVEVNGKRYEGKILGEKIVVSLQEKQLISNISYSWFVILLLLILGVVVWYVRKKKSSVV